MDKNIGEDFNNFFDNFLAVLDGRITFISMYQSQTEQVICIFHSRFREKFSSPPNTAIFGLPSTFSWPNHLAEASAMHAKLAIQRNPPI